MDDTLSALAIESTRRARATYMKFLSANDTGQTGAHQSGFLIGRCTYDMAFAGIDDAPVMKHSGLSIRWQGDFVTGGTFTRYRSKRGEMRLTGMGRGFPFTDPDYTGALWVLCQVDEDDYESYVLNTDDEIEDYLTAFSLGPQDANSMVDKQAVKGMSYNELDAISRYARDLGMTPDSPWPASQELARVARAIRRRRSPRDADVDRPDTQLIGYTRVEYLLFREIEACAYLLTIRQGFDKMDDFLSLANSILNRRKSRAGKSLEHHLASIFRANELEFEEQARTEGNKRPDFVFPSGAAYHDPSFPTERLVVLGAKTTCKDRWRQVVTEADRVGVKYLVTMQQGISPRQLDEMMDDNVQLVVPKPYIPSYPPAYQDKIWFLGQFIGHVKDL